MIYNLIDENIVFGLDPDKVSIRDWDDFFYIVSRLEEAGFNVNMEFDGVLLENLNVWSGDRGSVSSPCFDYEYNVYKDFDFGDDHHPFHINHEIQKTFRIMKSMVYRIIHDLHERKKDSFWKKIKFWEKD